jgi:ADP-ribose pyrophosphatase
MKIVGRKQLYSGFLSLEELTIQDEGNKSIKREVIKRPDAVAGIVYNTKTQKYIFVKQFRPAAEKDVVEIVAGTMDVEGESFENCMKREVEEEIGYKTDTIQSIHSCYSSPGSLTEMIHIFYVEVSEKISEGGGVGDENLEIIELTYKQLSEHSTNDAKTIIAIQWLKYHQLQKLLLH